MPEGYTLNGTAKEGTITTITNKYAPEETAATVKKVWDDASNQDGKRPDSLKVTLSNGTEVTLNADNEWTATVTGLPKYADGQEIEYTWTEGGLPEGYTLTNTVKEGTITTLTNSYTPEETEATVKKVADQHCQGRNDHNTDQQLHARRDRSNCQEGVERREQPGRKAPREPYRYTEQRYRCNAER